MARGIRTRCASAASACAKEPTRRFRRTAKSSTAAAPPASTWAPAVRGLTSNRQPRPGPTTRPLRENDIIATMSRAAAPQHWGHSTVRTACPLDCPDACTLEVTVENGRILKIDGGDASPTTRNFICAKVRRFDERVYGEDRLLYPAVRRGSKGDGTFTRVS